MSKDYTGLKGGIMDIGSHESTSAATGGEASIPSGWRGRLQEMRDAAYTYSQYPELAHTVFDSVIAALGELEAAQKQELCDGERKAFEIALKQYAEACHRSESSSAMDAARARVCAIFSRAAQSGQRAVNTSDDLWNEALILKIVEELNIMFASAQCEVDESDGIIGYRVKTGALHRIVGALAGIGQSVSIPANMPVVGQRAGVAEDAARFRWLIEHADYACNDFWGDTSLVVDLCPEAIDKAMGKKDA